MNDRIARYCSIRLQGLSRLRTIAFVAALLAHFTSLNADEAETSYTIGFGSFAPISTEIFIANGDGLRKSDKRCSWGFSRSRSDENLENVPSASLID